MALNVPIGSAIVSHEWVNAGDPDPYVITYGVRNTTEPDPELWNGMINAAWTAGGLNDDGIIPVGYSYMGATVRYREAGGYIVFPSSGSIAGTGVFSPLPSNCAVLVRKNTLSGGRKNRGRFYLPAGFMGELAVDSNGFINSMAMDIISPAVNNTFGELTVEQDFDVLLFHNSADPPTVVTSWTVQPQIATQRRRMRH